MVVVLVVIARAATGLGGGLLQGERAGGKHGLQIGSGFAVMAATDSGERTTVHEKWPPIRELCQRLHHRIAHLRGADLGGAFAVDVGRAQALGPAPFARRLRCAGRRLPGSG
jgi:hypothetical protein